MIKHVYSKHMFMGYQYDNFKDLKTYLPYFTFLGISSLLITTFSRIIHFFAQKSIIVRCQWLFSKIRVAFYYLLPFITHVYLGLSSRSSASLFIQIIYMSFRSNFDKE